MPNSRLTLHKGLNPYNQALKIPCPIDLRASLPTIIAYAWSGSASFRLWFQVRCCHPDHSAVGPVMGHTFFSAVIKVWANLSLECWSVLIAVAAPSEFALTGSHRIGSDSDKRSLPRGLFFIFYLWRTRCRGDRSMVLRWIMMHFW